MLTICVNEIVVLKVSPSCIEHDLDSFDIVVLSYGSIGVRYAFSSFSLHALSCTASLFVTVQAYC